MVLDLENVGNVTFICEQDEKCSNTEIYCPPDVASCNLIGRSPNALQNVVVFVDESFESRFLDIECTANSTCGDVDVRCEGDANIQDEMMKWNDSDSDGVGEYYCSNGDGASYCCLERECPIFNDPEMGFDTDLLDIDSSGDETIWYNATVDLLEGTETCNGSICALRCRNLLSCAFSTIIIESNQTTIDCDDLYSCLGATIIVDEHLVAHNVTILCLGVF